jgi:hypothetical protein
MQLVAGVLEQLPEPLPAVGRLKRRLGLPSISASSSRNFEASLSIGRASSCSPSLVDHGHVRAAVVQVDADPSHSRLVGLEGFEVKRVIEECDRLDLEVELVARAGC